MPVMLGCRAETAGEAADQVQGQCGILLEEPEKVPRGDGEDTCVFHGFDARHAGLLVDHRQLADELAGAEACDLGAAPNYTRRAGQDDVEPAPELSLSDDELAGRELDLACHVGQPRHRLLADALEERHASERDGLLLGAYGHAPDDSTASIAGVAAGTDLEAPKAARRAQAGALDRRYPRAGRPLGEQRLQIHDGV